jgi:hypothetical protein
MRVSKIASDQTLGKYEKKKIRKMREEVLVMR